MYPRYGIRKPPIPLRHNIPPNKSNSWRILNPISVQNPSVRAESWDPVSTSALVSTPSTTTIASLAWLSSHTKGSGLWYQGSAGLLVHTDVPGSPPLDCVSLGAGWSHLLPSPNFHLKTLTSPISPTLILKTFDPIMVMSLMIVLIVALTPRIMLISIIIPYTSWLLRVTGCGPPWPLHHHSQLCNLLSDWHCHPSHPTAPISLILPPGSVLLLLQLLSQVEGTLSFGHQKGSAWNHATACKIHERGNPFNIIGYSCWTAFSTTCNQVTYTVTLSVFSCCNL